MEDQLVQPKTSKSYELIFCLFLGIFGAHKFYVGKWLWGIIYLITFGFLGLGVLIDFFIIVLYRKHSEEHKEEERTNEDDDQGSFITQNALFNTKHIGCSIFLGIALWLLMLWIIFIFVCLFMNIVQEDYFLSNHSEYDLEKIFTNKGKYQVSTKTYFPKNSSFTQYKIWYPDLKNSNDLLPVIFFANPKGISFSLFQPLFEHLASFGIVCVGNNYIDPSNGNAIMETYNLLKNNNNFSECQINMSNVGVVGYKEGSSEVINFATSENGRKYVTSLYVLAPPSDEYIKRFSNLKYSTQNLKAKFFQLASGYEQEQWTYSSLLTLQNNMENLTNFNVYAQRVNDSNLNMLQTADPYMTAWFLYTLKNDETAKKVFQGDNGEKAEIEKNKYYINAKFNNTI